MKYLEAILNQLQGEEVTPPWTGPSSAHVTVSALLYASLSASLLAAFFAMLGKQWLHRYTRHKGGSAAERCEDRQRKLDGGIERWPFRVAIEAPSVLLQISHLLLLLGLSRYLLDVCHAVLWVVIGFAACGALFYVGFFFVGSFSYEFPFQTPPSLILRNLVNWLTKKIAPNLSPLPDPGAGCVFWVLNRITDPEMVIAALGVLVNIRWHHIPSTKVPLEQVANIYTKCFDAKDNLISKYRDTANWAARALIQLYVHRMCSDENSDHKHKNVTNALDHLSGRQNDDAFRPVSLIVKDIRNPGQDPEYQWEMTRFDLPWVSELWMYYAWSRRARADDVGGIIKERGFLATVEMLFEKEGAPPPVAVQNVLRGLLAIVSSPALPLDKFINLQQ